MLLANQAAALDVLSRGRFALAVGAGWNPAEFAAVGVPVSERGARTDEALRVLRLMTLMAGSIARAFRTAFRSWSRRILSTTLT